MKHKLRTLLERYLTTKIAVEFKCCITFFCMLFFYCVYRWTVGFPDAAIVHIFVMAMLAYVLGWIQALMGSDFDDVDRLGWKEWLLITIFSAVYALTSHFCGWFSGNALLSCGFFVYSLGVYLSTFVLHAVKRLIDARLLNRDLKEFQQKTEEPA